MDTLKHTRGFSTLEILIAMVIAVTTITSVILVSFSNQSTILGAETNAEAVAKAEGLAESAHALGRLDFNLVNSVATTTDGIYDKSVTVTLQPDFLTKLVTTFVAWTGDHGQKLYSRVDSLVTNLENVTSPNTCGSTLSGDWTNPQMSPPIDIGGSSSGNPVQDIDVHGKKLYIATDNQHGGNDDFYIYDASADPLNPTYVSSLQTVTAHAGLNAVALASTTVKKYAYVASANDPTFNSCTPGPNCSQLQVIDVTNAAVPLVVTNYLVPTSTAPFVLGTGGQAIGKSVFYRDGIVYLGLSKTGSGPEFIVIDVGGGGSGGSALFPKYLGSYPVGAGVSSIFVKGKYAYVSAADNTRELMMLDVSTPSAPTLAGVYNAPGTTNFGYGKTQYVVGNTVYFGRTYVSNAPEFYFLNATDPAAITSLASKDVGTAVDTQSVNGVLVRDYLAFLTTSDFFQVWNITTPSAMSLVRQFDLTALVGPGSGGIATDCEGNYIYVGSYRSNNDKGVILAVYPGVPLTYSLSNTGGITVAPGGSGNTSVTRTLVSGSAGSVTLNASGLPAGATATFTNNPCTTTCASTVTITTTGAVVPGTYPITVTGSPGGTTNPTTIFNLVVTPPPFDYSLSAAPLTQTLAQGASYTEVVTVTQTAGTAQSVTVSLSGFQNNVSYTPLTASCTPSPTCTVTFTITAASNGQKVTRTITATGATPTRTTTFSLKVQ